MGESVGEAVVVEEAGGEAGAGDSCAELALMWTARGNTLFHHGGISALLGVGVDSLLVLGVCGVLVLGVCKTASSRKGNDR